MKISRQDRKENPYLDKLYNKLLTTYYKVRDRTTNPNNSQWKDYGGRGVILSEEWHNLESFIRDADKIPGWDEESYMSGLLELDKDIRVPGNKKYSLETCKWVTHKENMQVQPLRQTEFYAYNEYSEELGKFTSRKAFIEKYNLPGVAINGALHGRKHRIGDWWVWLSSEEPPTPKRYVYTDKYGNSMWDVNKQRLSLRLGKNRAYISQLIKKNSPRVNIITINLSNIIKQHKSSTTIEKSS